MFFTGLRSFPPGKHLLGYSVTLVPGSVSAHTSLPSFCTVVYAHSVIILSSKVTDLIQHPPTLPLLCALQQLHHFSAWLENKVHHLRDDENSDTVTRIKQQAFELPLNRSAVLYQSLVQNRFVHPLCNRIHVTSKLRFKNKCNKFAPSCHLPKRQEKENYSRNYFAFSLV